MTINYGAQMSIYDFSGDLDKHVRDTKHQVERHRPAETKQARHAYRLKSYYILSLGRTLGGHEHHDDEQKIVFPHIYLSGEKNKDAVDYYIDYLAKGATEHIFGLTKLEWEWAPFNVKFNVPAIKNDIGNKLPGEHFESRLVDDFIIELNGNCGMKTRDEVEENGLFWQLDGLVTDEEQSKQELNQKTLAFMKSCFAYETAFFAAVKQAYEPELL